MMVLEGLLVKLSHCHQSPQPHFLFEDRRPGDSPFDTAAKIISRLSFSCTPRDDGSPSTHMEPQWNFTLTSRQLLVLMEVVFKGPIKIPGSRSITSGFAPF
jgi:hypothetical protein